MDRADKETRKQASRKKNKKRSLTLSAFTIILILTFVLGLVTWLLPEAKFVAEELIDGSGVERASLAQTLLAPILGFADAIDICLFVLILVKLLQLLYFLM